MQRRRRELIREFEGAIDSVEPQDIVANETVFRSILRLLLHSVTSPLLEKTKVEEMNDVLVRTFHFIDASSCEDIRFELEGDLAKGAVLFLCLRDQPFLVATVSMCLTDLGIRYRNTLNAIVPVIRNADSMGLPWARPATRRALGVLMTASVRAKRRSCHLVSGWSHSRLTHISAFSVP